MFQSVSQLFRIALASACFLAWCFTSQVTLAQQSAKLITRYEIGGSSIDSMGEYSAPILEYLLKEPDRSLTIRLCSAQPLPVAIGTAAVEPETLSDYLDRYRVSRDRILINRSNSCAGKSATNTATELWVGLPPETDGIRACELTVREIQSRSDKARKIYIGTGDHVRAIKRLIEELKKDPSTTGVVLGYYLEKPTAQTTQKLRSANALLRKSGLSADRYRVTPLYWTGWPETEGPIRHLTIRIVKTNNQCDLNRPAKSTVWLKP